MSNVVASPTPEVLALADQLDDCVRRFLDARSTMRADQLWKYESSAEALHLLYLALRHFEGLVCLARNDLILYPPAAAVARAGAEACVRAAWMLRPLDPMEREARYLAHLESEESHLNTLIAASSKPAILEKWRDQVRSFRLGVEALLPSRVKRVVEPKLKAMVLQVAGKKQYVSYQQLSQPVHASHIATGQFRQNLGTAKVMKENVDPSDWRLPFVLSFELFSLAGSLLLNRTCGSVTRFLPQDFRVRTASLLDALLPELSRREPQ